MPLPDRIAPHRLAVTSGGSTGRPKLILSANGPRSSTGTSHTGTDGVIGIPGPLYHNGPLSNALDGICAGNHVVISPRFDAAATLAAIEAYRIGWIFLVPTMMLRIWRLPDDVKARFDSSSLRCVWHMGAPCPEWLKEAWIGWVGGEKIFEMYTATRRWRGRASGGMSGLRTGDPWAAHSSVR